MDKITEIELEVEELAIQLADMLAVALHFAGVKEKNLQKATDAYLDAIDDFFGDNEDGEMGFDEIVGTINLLKKNKPELFK